MNLNADRALVRRAQTSAAGFGELFDTYYDRIYAYAYRRVRAQQVAEDIAASVFEDALKGIQRFRWQGKPIAAWLYKIAARRVADVYRERVVDELNDEVKDSADFADKVSERVSVRDGLSRLSKSDREIIRLAFFDELGTEEIAALLNGTANNVYVRLHRALKRLKAVMEVSDESAS